MRSGDNLTQQRYAAELDHVNEYMWANYFRSTLLGLKFDRRGRRSSLQIYVEVDTALNLLSSPRKWRDYYTSAPADDDLAKSIGLLGGFLDAESVTSVSVRLQGLFTTQKVSTITNIQVKAYV